MRSRSDSHLIIKPGDIIIIAAVLLVAVIAVLFINNSGDGNTVVITSGKNTATYSLEKDRKIDVQSENGGHNTVVISDGKVWVCQADCKNQICVNHSPIYKDHESIVCIPNKMIVKIVSNNDNDIDN